MPGHLEPQGFVGPNVQALIGRDIEIDDRITVLADEVVVGLHIGIEAIKGAAKGNPADETLLGEDANVSIDSPQAEVGELLPQLAIQPVCGGVSFRRLQQFEDPLSLPATPVRYLFLWQPARVFHQCFSELISS